MQMARMGREQDFKGLLRSYEAWNASRDKGSRQEPRTGQGRERLFVRIFLKDFFARK
jgi:hypothetical protein